MKLGGTPPVSIQNTQVLIDPKVMEMEKVIGGGGTRRHLLQISPQEIVQATGAIIPRIRK
ncbi:MAG: YbaK/EbsC family protein [Candidatus Hodarchaeota archaeon]